MGAEGITEKSHVRNYTHAPPLFAIKNGHVSKISSGIKISFLKMGEDAVTGLQEREIPPSFLTDLVILP